VGIVVAADKKKKKTRGHNRQTAHWEQATHMTWLPSDTLCG